MLLKNFIPDVKLSNLVYFLDKRIHYMVSDMNIRDYDKLMDLFINIVEKEKTKV